MITSRPMELHDLDILEDSLEIDAYHQGTTAEFFGAPGTMCNVYEDEQGPVFFLRGAKALRLDIQFVSNADSSRNRTAMLAALEPLVENAQNSGFTELVFNTTNPMLKVFCKRRLKFQEVEGDELRKLI